MKNTSRPRNDFFFYVKPGTSLFVRTYVGTYDEIPDIIASADG